MWCPRCGGEFREGFDRCSECEVALVESDPELEPSRHTLTTSPVLVFDFAERTIHDGDRRRLGSCVYRRRGYHVESVSGVPVWSWRRNFGSFFDTVVSTPSGERIGSLHRRTLEAGGRSFGTLEFFGRNNEVRSPSGLTLATLVREKHFLATHVQVVVTLSSSLAVAQRIVAAGIACSFEASAAFSE